MEELMNEGILEELTDENCAKWLDDLITEPTFNSSPVHTSYFTPDSSAYTEDTNGYLVTSGDTQEEFDQSEETYISHKPSIENPTYNQYFQPDNQETVELLDARDLLPKECLTTLMSTMQDFGYDSTHDTLPPQQQPLQQQPLQQQPLQQQPLQQQPLQQQPLQQQPLQQQPLQQQPLQQPPPQQQQILMVQQSAPTHHMQDVYTSTEPVQYAYRHCYQVHSHSFNTRAPPHATQLPPENILVSEVYQSVKTKKERKKRVSTPPGMVKPAEPYVELIAKAILSCAEKKMLITDIYDWFMTRYPIFAIGNIRSWRNSVRHNLSLMKCFMKNNRSDGGRGYYWSVHPQFVDDFANGHFDVVGCKERKPVDSMKKQRQHKSKLESSELITTMRHPLAPTESQRVPISVSYQPVAPTMHQYQTSPGMHLEDSIQMINDVGSQKYSSQSRTFIYPPVSVAPTEPDVPQMLYRQPEQLMINDQCYQTLH